MNVEDPLPPKSIPDGLVSWSPSFPSLSCLASTVFFHPPSWLQTESHIVPPTHPNLKHTRALKKVRWHLKKSKLTYQQKCIPMTCGKTKAQCRLNQKTSWTQTWTWQNPPAHQTRTKKQNIPPENRAPNAWKEWDWQIQLNANEQHRNSQTHILQTCLSLE